MAFYYTQELPPRTSKSLLRSQNRHRIVSAKLKIRQNQRELRRYQEVAPNKERLLVKLTPHQFLEPDYSDEYALHEKSRQRFLRAAELKNQVLDRYKHNKHRRPHQGNLTDRGHYSSLHNNHNDHNNHGSPHSNSVQDRWTRGSMTQRGLTSGVRTDNNNSARGNTTTASIVASIKQKRRQMKLNPKPRKEMPTRSLRSGFTLKALSTNRRPRRRRGTRPGPLGSFVLPAADDTDDEDDNNDGERSNPNHDHKDGDSSSMRKDAKAGNMSMSMSMSMSMGGRRNLPADRNLRIRHGLPQISNYKWQDDTDLPPLLKDRGGAESGNAPVSAQEEARGDKAGADAAVSVSADANSGTKKSNDGRNTPTLDDARGDSDGNSTSRNSNHKNHIDHDTYDNSNNSHDRHAKTGAGAQTPSPPSLSSPSPSPSSSPSSSSKVKSRCSVQPILAHIDPTWEQQEGRVGKVLVTRGMRLQIIQSLGVGGGNDDSNNDRDHSNSDDNSFSKGDRKTGMGGDGTEKELVATHIMGVVKVLQCYSDSSFFLSFYQLDETEEEGHHSKIIHLTIDHVLAMFSKSPAYTKALKVSRQVQMLANEKKRGVKQKHDKRYVKLEEKEKAERKLIEVAEHLTKGLMYKRTWSNGKHHQLKHKGDGDFMGVGADSNSSRYSQAERLFFSAAPPESTHSSSLHLFFLPNYVLNSVYGSNYQITPGPSSRRLSLAAGDKHENENARSTRKKRVDAKAMRAKPVLQKGCTIDGRYVIVSCFVEKGTNSYAFKAYDMKDSFEYYCAVPFSHLPFHSDSTVDGGDGGGGGNTTHANPTHHLHTNTRNSKGQTVKEFLDAHIPRLHLRAVGKRSSSLEIGHRSIASQTINDAMISHGMLELKFE